MKKALFILLTIVPALAVSWIMAPRSGSVRFVSHPRTVVAFEGEGATFTVSTNPREAQVQWCKDGKAIPGATGHVYALQEALEGDEGTYTALARLPGNLIWSKSEPATLTYVPLVTVLVDGKRALGGVVDTKRPVTVAIVGNIRGFRSVTYTLSGEEPDQNSTPYTGPITVEGPCWMRIWVDGKESVESVRIGPQKAFVPGAETE